MFSSEDIQQIEAKGISVEEIERQLACFKNGFPYLPIADSASIGKGILKFSSEEETPYLNTWDEYLRNHKGKVVKFVPASGAASRMFKDLFAFLDAEYQEPDTSSEKIFCTHCHCFAFSPALDQVCRQNEGESLESLAAKGKYKCIIRNLLQQEGLNYGALPKGLLLFHSYPEGARKAFTEHLVEGALYTKDSEGNVFLHFTVCPEHIALFQEEVEKVRPSLEAKYDAHIHIEFSVQKASTDTIAANADNQAFRDAGKLVFRPGGHGALIENLNELDADILFIKNIDNVVPDHFKASTVHYKKVLAGLLVSLQEQTFKYLRILDTGKYSRSMLIEMIQFLQQKLYTRNPDIKHLEDAELVLYLKKKLNRPMRVCGMVRNEGEAGGGPFLVYNQDGTTSLQILESSQIDMDDPKKAELFKEGTHFNPVDLVCAIKNYKGEKFSLKDYVDPSTGFISSKSKNGQALKALELPGLWNGAMSDWNTVFVEVPIATFNPVKTVNDLLREQHQ